MPTVNIHDAKTHLSRLIEQAVQGEQVIIAKGKRGKTPGVGFTLGGRDSG